MGLLWYMDLAWAQVPSITTRLYGSFSSSTLGMSSTDIESLDGYKTKVLGDFNKSSSPVCLEKNKFMSPNFQAFFWILEHYWEKSFHMLLGSVQQKFAPGIHR